MDNQPKTTYRNALLQRLSPLDLALVAPHLEPVDLPLRTSLETAKSVIEYALSTALSESNTLKALLLLYVQTLFIQTSYTALVNARSKLEERLARWLLMCQDRVRDDRFSITHAPRQES